MVGKLDRALAGAGWILAAVLAGMLFIGPQVIAEDKKEEATKSASPYSGSGSGGEKVDGKAVFIANCGSCHALAAAGTSGKVGPDLSKADVAASDVRALVEAGTGMMPSFKGQLSAAEIEAVAAFVAEAR